MYMTTCVTRDRTQCFPAGLLGLPERSVIGCPQISVGRSWRGPMFTATFLARYDPTEKSALYSRRLRATIFLRRWWNAMEASQCRRASKKTNLLTLRRPRAARQQLRAPATIEVPEVR